MLLRPTRDNKKQKTNNERIWYPAKFPGLGEALIFFSHPFLASRQEKDVGARGQRPPPSMLYAPNGKNLVLPIVLNPPLSGRLWGVCDTPLQGTSKKGDLTTKKPGTHGEIQLRTRHFLRSVFSGQLLLRCAHSNSRGLQMHRQRMLAIEIISANTPAAVTSAPAP